MTPSIAILGAGPSGLALARYLHIANIDFVVFERDESETWAMGRGGTLDLHTSTGQLALQEIGLLDQFKALARLDVTNVVADANGKVCFKTSEKVDSDRPEIDRKDLRAMLLNSIPTEKVRWASRVQQVDRIADGSVSIRFADGSSESGFRLVVGADGAWSKVRSVITHAKPEYSGRHYLTTLIKPSNPKYTLPAALAGRGNYMAFGNGKQIAAQRLGDGSYYVVVGLALPEHWAEENAALVQDSATLRQALVLGNFAEWAKVHTDLIAHSDSEFHVWPLYAMPTESLAWKSVPGVTLIGDAAHVSTPFVGEGVNCALYDSLQLGQQIVKHGLGDIESAVAEYEKLMFPRAIDLITRSRRSGEMLFAQDSPYGWLRAHVKSPNA